MSPHTGRYKIIERGRRLITIDTLTGTELGQLPPPPPGLAEFASSNRKPGSAERSSLTVSPKSQDSRQARSSKSGDVNSGRLMLVIIAGVALVFFLILTNLWVVVALAIAFVAPVRTAVFKRAFPAIGRFVRQL